MALNSPFNYEIHGAHRHYDYRYPNGEERDEMQRMNLQPYWARKEMDRRDDNVLDNHEKFAVQLNVSNFKPEELKVSLVGRHLCVEGHHEEKKDGHGMISRSFKRSYLLPKDCDLDGVSSHVSDHGLLSVQAPKFHPNEGEGRAIPIQSGK
ncbi:unnamed protein product, partial [Mesorhabditis belari]|uniref:SHSP domain-containing protein n=1 Tax=Mesorhabditis belari TaxID=2138241 RepID=A0AAF3FSB6_9BILA